MGLVYLLTFTILTTQNFRGGNQNRSLYLHPSQDDTGVYTGVGWDSWAYKCYGPGGDWHPGWGVNPNDVFLFGITGTLKYNAHHQEYEYLNILDSFY